MGDFSLMNSADSFLTSHSSLADKSIIKTSYVSSYFIEYGVNVCRCFVKFCTCYVASPKHMYSSAMRCIEHKMYFRNFVALITPTEMKARLLLHVREVNWSSFRLNFLDLPQWKMTRTKNGYTP